MTGNWITQALSDLCEVEYGTRVVRKKDGGSIYPVYGGGGATFQMDMFNREDCFIVSRFGMSADCVRKVDGRFFLNDSGLSVRSRKPDCISQAFLDLQLFARQSEIYSLGRGTAQKNLDVSKFRELPISYPESLDEQQRIVAALDNAFAAIAVATVNAEKNLANARELFASELDALMTEVQAKFQTGPLIDQCERITVGHVGPMKERYEADGIPFLRSQNVRPFEISFDGMMFIDEQFDTELQKSRLRPGDVAVVRTGYPGTAAVIPETLPIANCSDLVIIRPGKSLNPHFVAAFLNSNIGKRAVLGKLVGAAQKHFNVGAAKQVSIPLPPLSKQGALVDRVAALAVSVKQLIELCQQRQRYLVDLKSAILARAFADELKLEALKAASSTESVNFASPKFTAQIIAFAHRLHEAQQSQKTFGHVKAQKALHLVEAIGCIDLGRQPIKDAAGPNDFTHMLRATDWAAQKGFFEFVPRASGKGYDFKKLGNYHTLWIEAREAVAPIVTALEQAIDPIVPMVSLDAEVFATVHAAWNNLLRDGATISDDAIVKEARDNWHSAKLSIPEAKFRAAIRTIRAKRLMPDGSAKYVGGQGSLF